MYWFSINDVYYLRHNHYHLVKNSVLWITINRISLLFVFSMGEGYIFFNLSRFSNEEDFNRKLSGTLFGTQ